jgi:hypothetical protein
VLNHNVVGDLADLALTDSYAALARRAMDTDRYQQSQTRHQEES